MKYRKQGRWIFGQKSDTKSTTWTTTPPPPDTELYVVAWGNGQQSLLASRKETQE
jgi:hypothetical protein